MVTADAADTARTLAAEGVAVILVGADEEAGRVVADIERSGGRAAAFVGDLGNEDDRAALAEMLDELFTPRSA